MFLKHLIKFIYFVLSISGNKLDILRDKIELRQNNTSIDTSAIDRCTESNVLYIGFTISNKFEVDNLKECFILCLSSESEIKCDGLTYNSETRKCTLISNPTTITEDIYSTSLLICGDICCPRISNSDLIPHDLILKNTKVAGRAVETALSFKTFDECFIGCRNYKGCVAFEFNIWYMVCTFTLNETADFYISIGGHSVVIDWIEKPYIPSCSENGSRYEGTLILYTGKAGSISECYNICDNIPECTGISFTSSGPLPQCQVFKQVIGRIVDSTWTSASKCGYWCCTVSEGYVVPHECIIKNTRLIGQSYITSAYNIDQCFLNCPHNILAFNFNINSSTCECVYDNLYIDEDVSFNGLYVSCVDRHTTSTSTKTTTLNINILHCVELESHYEGDIYMSIYNIYNIYDCYSFCQGAVCQGVTHNALNNTCIVYSNAINKFTLVDAKSVLKCGTECCSNIRTENFIQNEYIYINTDSIYTDTTTTILGCSIIDKSYEGNKINVIADSDIQCHIECLNNPECEGSNYSIYTNECTLVMGITGIINSKHIATPRHCIPESYKHCIKNNYLYTGETINEVHNMYSVLQCLSLCIKTQYCTAINYDEGKCILIGKVNKYLYLKESKTLSIKLDCFYFQ